MNKKFQYLMCLFICAFSAQIVGAQSSVNSINPIAPLKNEWTYSLTPYAWLPGVSSDIPVPPSSSSTDVSAGDVLKHLSGAAMISGQANYGRWGILADMAHAELSNESVRGFDVRLANSSASIKLNTYTLASTYNLVHSPKYSLDAVVGLRNVNATVSWSIDFQSLTDQSGSKNVNATDPILGVKGRARIQETDWYVPFYFDVGAKGGRTDVTWQALVGVGRTYSWGDVMLGYRALYYDMKADQALQKTTLAGFTFGVGFKF